MKNWLSKNWWKCIVAIASVALVCLAYYGFVIAPAKVRAENKISLQNCLSQANTDYLNWWSTACTNKITADRDGYKNCIAQGESDSFCQSMYPSDDDLEQIMANPLDSQWCTLGSAPAQALTSQLNQEKADCFQEFSQN